MQLSKRQSNMTGESHFLCEKLLFVISGKQSEVRRMRIDCNVNATGT